MTDHDDERGHGLQIARVGGVPVYIAPSWLVIAAVIVVIVGPPLAQARPDLVVLAYVVGVLQALVLLVSVLAHEGAHAVAARMSGLPVVRIVANLWGGHTAMESGRSTPGSMALVAAAGPLANAALALLGWLALAVTTAGGVPDRLVFSFTVTNAVLAAFNVLPGMPLDGGQLLESAVWKGTGSRNTGSVVAGWAGRGLAAVLVLVVVVRPLLSGQGLSFSAIWMLLIASVLWTGATASINRGRTLGRLERVRLADVLRPAVAAPGYATVEQALATGRDVVVSDAPGRLTAYADPATLATVPEGARASTPLTAVASQQAPGWVVEADPAGDVVPVVVALNEHQVTLLAVVHRGQLVGVVRVGDVNDALSRT